MNTFALSGLLIGIACTMMAGLVYFPNRRNRIGRLWAIFCLAVSLWGFSIFLLGLTPDPEPALVFCRLANVGVILIPALFYHFVAAFVNLRRSRSLAFLYMASAAFLLADATDLFIPQVKKLFGQFYYNSPPGPLYVVFTAFFLAVIGFGHLDLWRALRSTPDPKRRLLIRWLLVGTTIGFTGGALGFLPIFGIEVYPYGNFAVVLFPIIMTYAFLRYRLMDVNLAAVRGVTFLLLYALVIGLPFVAGSVYHGFWQRVLGQWWWVAPVALMGLLASMSPVLFLLIVRRLEQKLWKAQRRYHRTLIAASSGMTRIKDLRRLCRLIVYVVNRTVGLVNSGLFLFQPQQERYELVAARYNSLFPERFSIAQTDPLIEVIQKEQDLLVLEELQNILSVNRIPQGYAQKLTWAYSWMRRLEARLIVPSFSNDRLLAFLFLGGKRSGEAYTTDDVALFSALANQAALGIENALFFEELKTNEAYMIQSEKLASLGQLASGMAHEIHNPLTIISGEAQLYLERFKGKDQHVDQVLASIIEECHRAADITRRILRFAKPAPSEFCPVDLRATIDETLQLAAYQARLDRIERHVELPADLPKVRGNQNQLQEVFLNLILNACQAMGEQGGRLSVVATAKDDNVELRVSDTGCGIAYSKLSKIFDPFFTTKQNGTGLGLFVSQRIIRAHGGSIEVRSDEGHGTTFTVRLLAARAG